LEDIKTILDTCIILHNMVVEHNRDTYTINDWVSNQLAEHQLVNDGNVVHLTLFGNNNQGQPDQAVMGPGQALLRAQALATTYDDQMRHDSLKDDLVEHNWNIKMAGNG